MISFAKKIAVLAAFVAPHFALAATTISVGIPGQTAISSSSPPGAFINDFYQFSIFAGGLLAFAVIVYGGVKYMISAGNPSGQSDAKEWIWGALLGLLLLGCAYLILAVINPQLINLNLPQITSAGITLPPISGGPSIPGGGGGKVCAAPAGGACTVANLQSTCFASNAQTWAGICNNESRGNATLVSGTDWCNPPTGQTCGGQTKCGVSVGLFQINLTDSWRQSVTLNGKSYNCSQAFSGAAVSCSSNGSRPCTTGHNGTGQACQVTNLALYNACVQAAQQAQANINVACALSNNGTNYGPWKADASCY